MTAGAIRDVVVVGGGIVGWSAAAALKRRVPTLAVTILPLPPAPDALADRVTATLPSILGFHADLGLSGEDAVLKTGSGLRLGTLFGGWAGAPADYVHAYGPHGRPFGTASFHQHWVRAALAGAVEPIELYSPAAALGRAGRFVPPAHDPGAVLTGFEYGLRIDPARYRPMLQALARHCGVAVRDGGLAGVRLRSDGFVDTLALDDGSELGADLFVDASGPAARVRGAFGDGREDWSGWFRCDRLLFGEAPADPAPPPLDRVDALAGGWRWVSPAVAGSACGIAYAAAHMDNAAAAGALAAVGATPAGAPIALAPGSYAEPWQRNCVAIGDAATVIEPLEWANLHLAHSQIDRMIAMLPGRDCAEVELAEFNRQSAAETMRVRDFLLLHYAVADRPEPFWRAAAAIDPPASLAHTLRLFRQRGRLPVYEEETFSKESWLAVLIGQGVLPDAADPLIDPIPPEQSLQAMARYREAIAAAVAAAPTPADHPNPLMRHSAR